MPAFGWNSSGHVPRTTSPREARGESSGATPTARPGVATRHPVLHREPGHVPAFQHVARRVHPAVLDFVAELGMLPGHREGEVDRFFVVHSFLVHAVHQVDPLLAVVENDIG